MVSQFLSSLRGHDPYSGIDGCQRNQFADYGAAQAVGRRRSKSAIRPGAILVLRFMRNVRAVQQTTYVVGDPLQGGKIHLMNPTRRGLMILDGSIDRPEEFLRT